VRRFRGNGRGGRWGGGAILQTTGLDTRRGHSLDSRTEWSTTGTCLDGNAGGVWRKIVVGAGQCEAKLVVRLGDESRRAAVEDWTTGAP